MEYVDIFDDNNNPLGIIKEKLTAHEEGDFHRTAHIWIMNSRRELLLKKRSKTKKTHPNCWDISGAGHIMAGETVLEGAIREFVFIDIGTSIICPIFGCFLGDVYRCE